MYFEIVLKQSMPHIYLLVTQSPHAKRDFTNLGPLCRLVFQLQSKNTSLRMSRHSLVGYFDQTLMYRILPAVLQPFQKNTGSFFLVVM